VKEIQGFEVLNEEMCYSYRWHTVLRKAGQSTKPIRTVNRLRVIKWNSPRASVSIKGYSSKWRKITLISVCYIYIYMSDHVTTNISRGCVIRNYLCSL